MSRQQLNLLTWQHLGSINDPRHGLSSPQQHEPPRCSHLEPLPKPPGWTTLVTTLSPSPSDATFVRTSLQRLRILCHGNVQDIDIAYRDRLAAVLAHGPKGRENPRDNAANLQQGRDALTAAGVNNLGSIHPVLRRWSAMPEVLPTASFSVSPLIDIMDPPPQPQSSFTRAYNRASDTISLVTAVCPDYFSQLGYQANPHDQGRMAAFLEARHHAWVSRPRAPGRAYTNWRLNAWTNNHWQGWARLGAIARWHASAISNGPLLRTHPVSALAAAMDRICTPPFHRPAPAPSL